LLDTHTFLWYIRDDSKLSKTAAELLEDTENQPVLSVASPWEIAIKVSLGKLEINMSFKDLLKDKVDGLDIELFHMTAEHFDVLAGLPFHHRDPFNRLILAQCLSENLPLLNKDSALSNYGLKRLW